MAISLVTVAQLRAVPADWTLGAGEPGGQLAAAKAVRRAQEQGAPDHGGVVPATAALACCDRRRDGGDAVLVHYVPPEYRMQALRVRLGGNGLSAITCASRWPGHHHDGGPHAEPGRDLGFQRVSDACHVGVRAA